MPFTTISVSDGVSMNHKGMRMSLVSRELIADSIEAVVRAHAYDALVGFAGCDKTLPGVMMAMVRLNCPSVFVYGGAMLPGSWRGRDVTILTAYEGVGSVLDGTMTEAELRRARPRLRADARLVPRPVHRQHDGDGGRDARPRDARLGDAAGGLLASASRWRASAGPARHRDWCATAARCRATWSRASRSRTPPPRWPPPAARTNAGLHLPAIAHEAGIRFTLDDVAEVFARTPLIADLQPGGKLPRASTCTASAACRRC